MFSIMPVCYFRNANIGFRFGISVGMIRGKIDDNFIWKKGLRKVTLTE